VSRAKSARGGRGISFACATPTLRATVWLMEVWSVLVSYPDDVKESVSTVKRAIHFVNELLATFRVPLILNCRNWKDTTPGAHPVSVQQKIEEDLRFDDCDIVIGLFWKRLGTKRPGTKSGCERELQIAVDACKLNRRPNVLTYFNQEMTPPATGSIEDAENQLGLAKLKDHLQSLNVQTADYNGDRELERLLVKHLMSLAGGASIADTRLQSAIKGKVFYRQWDFRVEAAAELIPDIEFKFELPKEDPNRIRELDIEVTLTTFIAHLFGDPGPRLVVNAVGHERTFAPRIVDNNKLRFEGIPVAINEDTQVLLKNLRCDANGLSISAALEPRPVWMFLSVSEGPRAVSLDFSQIPLGMVRRGAWLTLMDAKHPYEQLFSHVQRCELSETPKLVGWLRYTEGFPGAFKTADEEVGKGDPARSAEGIVGTRFFAGFHCVPAGMRVFVTPINRLPGGTPSDKPQAILVPDCQSDGSDGVPRLVSGEWVEVRRRNDLIDVNLAYGVVWEWVDKHIAHFEPESVYFGVALAVDSDVAWREACPMVTSSLAPFSVHARNSRIQAAPAYFPSQAPRNLRIVDDRENRNDDSSNLPLGSSVVQ
jgi:hypothetical protein